MNTRVTDIIQRPIFLISLLCTFWVPSLFANSLTIATDRQQVEMGDILTLEIHADFQTFGGQPDFSLLDDQFKVLGTQRSNSVRMINGNFSTETFWTVRLTPLQTGELVIPPFTVDGATSQPYRIQVSKTTPAAGQAKAHFLEAEVSTSTPYVQQQVIYSLRYYHQGRLLTGNIRPPQFDQSLVEQLGKQRTYQKNLNGQLYDVYEWRYAFYPQQSGQLTIQPQAFSGQLNYRGRMKQVHDTTQPITLQVQPKPTPYPAQATWLPAKKLTLSSDWQLPSTLRVGESATLTLQLQAEGLKASQLPTITLPDHPDYHLYPDKPQTDEAQESEGLVSLKQLKIALVPTQAGQLDLPALEIPWWNTTTNQMETLHLPSKTLMVEPPLVKNTPVTLAEKTAPLPLQTAEPKTEKASNLWPLLTLLFAILWGGTLLLWWRNRTKKSFAPTTQADETTNPISETAQNHQAWSFFKQIDQMCQANLDPLVLYNALRQWRQANQADYVITEEAWQQALLPLKAHLFNQAPFEQTEREALCQSLKAFHPKPSPEKSKGQRLAPLYPQ